MREKLKNIKISRLWLFVLFISAAGFVLRLICCYWGNPYQLHTDEGTIVQNTVEMLSRHSWEAYVYNRPDQFEIKCNAVLFTLASWIRYRMPAYEAFAVNPMPFYLVARFYTAMFGTAMIPLSSVFVSRLVKKPELREAAALFAAAITAFSPVFVQHSAYATPDIPLSFFVLLFAYFFMLYLENGGTRDIAICSVITGISITIKYPAAILCLLIAFMVIYRAAAIDKKYINIAKYAAVSIGLILASVFVIAPNLFTDIGSAYTIFVKEARPNHLGADGLGFFGNLWFYVKTAVQSLGIVSVVPFLGGAAYLVKNRSRSHWPLVTGAVFWVCLSCLSLHWTRWGLPMLVFYYLICALGFSLLLSAFGELPIKSKPLQLWLRVAACAVAAVTMLNALASSLAVTKFSTVKDTRVISKAFCEENGINAGNSLYESYTPFEILRTYSRANAFTVSGSDLTVNEEYTDKRYFIMSDSLAKRYLAEPERYPHEAAVYSALPESYELIYELRGDNYEQKYLAVGNTIHSFKYLFRHIEATGNTIYIYDMTQAPNGEVTDNG